MLVSRAEGERRQLVIFKAEEAGRAEFDVATPTYATVAYSVR